VLAIITAIIGVLYVLLFKDIDILEGEDDENAKFKFSRVIEAIKIPGLWYAGLVVFAFYSLLTTTSVFNQLLTNTYGMSNEQASFIAVFRTNGLGLIAGPALVFVVSRFKSTGKTLLATAIVEAVFVAAIMLLPKSTSYVMPAMIVVLAIAFLQLGARAIYFGQIGEAGIPDHILGTASGIISLIAYSSDIYMPQLVAGMITDKAGKIISSGYHTVYMLQFGLLAMVVVFSLLVWRESKKNKAKGIKDFTAA
jgi:sugar phosphate permease